MAHKIRVGIVGSGGRAGAHASAYLNFGGTEIVAFCDIVEERAQSRAKEFGATQIYTDYRSLIAESSVDVISICSSNETHAEVTIAAAEAGIHVLCEKPMGQSLKECDDMIAAAAKSGVVLACNFQSRFFPRTHWLKSQIEAGRLGDGVIAKGYGWTIHVWDLVPYVMGSPVRVSAEWGGEQQMYRDPLLATVRFEKGSARLAPSKHIGLMQASRFHEPQLPDRHNGFHFVGSKLTASFGLWANQLILTSEDADYAAEMERAKAEAFANQPLLAPSVPDIADFLRAVIDGSKPTIPGEEGRRSIEFVTATYKAALTNQTVSLPIEPSDAAYANPGRPVSA
ncbi:Gfo/Idh/MocA family oxidoreductase [Candidatus Poribacteria bacterium]|nr:Gfo/Idh/MocA family oxidoreductase [Candidatus Poribacteria bacterium]